MLRVFRLVSWQSYLYQISFPEEHLTDDVIELLLLSVPGSPWPLVLVVVTSVGVVAVIVAVAACCLWKLCPAGRSDQSSPMSSSAEVELGQTNPGDVMLNCDVRPCSKNRKL